MKKNVIVKTQKGEKTKRKGKKFKWKEKRRKKTLCAYKCVEMIEGQSKKSREIKKKSV